MIISAHLEPAETLPNAYVCVGKGGRNGPTSMMLEMVIKLTMSGKAFADHAVTLFSDSVLQLPNITNGLSKPVITKCYRRFLYY